MWPICAAVGWSGLVWVAEMHRSCANLQVEVFCQGRSQTGSSRVGLAGGGDGAATRERWAVPALLGKASEVAGQMGGCHRCSPVVAGPRTPRQGNVGQNWLIILRSALPFAVSLLVDHLGCQPMPVKMQDALKTLARQTHLIWPAHEKRSN